MKRQFSTKPVARSATNEKISNRPKRASAGFAVDRLRVVAEKTEEGVAPHTFRLAVVSVSVDGEPVDRPALFVLPVAVALVVLLVDALVELLRETDGDGLQPTECAIQNRRREVGVVEKIV
jgi:hypothetical protein